MGIETGYRAFGFVGPGYLQRDAFNREFSLLILVNSVSVGCGRSKPNIVAPQTSVPLAMEGQECAMEVISEALRTLMNCHIALSGYRREGRAAVKIRLMDNPAKSRGEGELVLAVEIAIGQLLLTPRDETF